MGKILILLSSLSLLLFTGCGGDPAPKKNSIEAIRAKLEAAHKKRFEQDGSSVRISRSDKKRLSDPDAYVYQGDVLSRKEEKKWKKEGISNKEFPQWAALGMRAKEVSQWKALNLSYPAIAVFYQHKYTPKTASKFMNQNFKSRPYFYQQFGTPVYEFDSICEGVIKRQSPPFAFLEEKCLPYMKASHKNEIMGHLIDKVGITKGPLVLEYLAELRHLQEQNSEIQSGMEVSMEEFIEDEDMDNFIFLFPFLQTEPTVDEMAFIDAHKLPLDSVERFLSYKNPQYWARRSASIKAAKEAAAREEALLRAHKEEERARKASEIAAAKAERARKEALVRMKKEDEKARAAAKVAAAKAAVLRKEELRKAKKAKERAIAAAKAAQKKAAAKAKALKEEQKRQWKLALKRDAARSKKAKKICGQTIAPDQLSRQSVYIDGEVVFVVGEAGSKMFGYGVRSNHDKEIYFIRDPKNTAKLKPRNKVIWKLKTMGRTEALSKLTKYEYVYDKKSKTKFEMALFVQECKL